MDCNSKPLFICEVELTINIHRELTDSESESLLEFFVYVLKDEIAKHTKKQPTLNNDQRELR